MAGTVQSSVNDKGVQRIVISLQTAASALSVYVGHLRGVTLQCSRGAGNSDTLAVTGSNDNLTFAAVTGTTQAATGGDTALTALTAAIHNIRQHVEYLKFTPSGNTDTFTIILSGTTRN